MLVLDPTRQGFLVNDPLAVPVLGRAGELSLPVYVHTGPHLYGGPWQLVDAALAFPDVRFIMGHAGATDFWNDVPSAGKFAPNIYIEGSFARPFIFMYHLDAAGIWRGVMGSAAPGTASCLSGSSTGPTCPQTVTGRCSATRWPRSSA